MRYTNAVGRDQINDNVFNAFFWNKLPLTVFGNFIILNCMYVFD